MDRCLARKAAGSGRSDDNAESLKKRFNTYVNANMPIVDRFRAQSKVNKINASQTPEQVFEEVKKLFS